MKKRKEPSSVQQLTYRDSEASSLRLGSPKSLDPEMAAIRVSHLSKQFGRQRSIPQLLSNRPVQFQSVLQDVSFAVGKGEVFGVLGTNGAGKTTLTRILCTMVLPDRGTVEVAGVNVVERPLQVRKAVGYVTCADRSFEERISAIDNLRFFAALNDLAGREQEHRVAEVLEQVGLWDAAGRAVREFSTGMKQKLAIARALLHEPQILFLDEPTSGLDPLASARFRDFLQQLAIEQQRTIFLCTHMPEEIEQLCDRVLFLHQGVSLASGTLDSVRRSVCERSLYEVVTLQPSNRSLIDSAIDGLAIPGVSIEGRRPSLVPPTPDGDWATCAFSVSISATGEQEAIADVIQYLLQHQLAVVECRKQVMSLADLYAALTEGVDGDR